MTEEETKQLWYDEWEHKKETHVSLARGVSASLVELIHDRYDIDLDVADTTNALMVAMVTNLAALHSDAQGSLSAAGYWLHHHDWPKIQGPVA